LDAGGDHNISLAHLYWWLVTIPKAVNNVFTLSPSDGISVTRSNVIHLQFIFVGMVGRCYYDEVSYNITRNIITNVIGIAEHLLDQAKPTVQI
jgi:hypothetical protein